MNTFAAGRKQGHKTMTDAERTTRLIILNLDSTIKDLMLQRDALAAMLPTTNKVRAGRVRTLKEIREGKR